MADPRMTPARPDLAAAYLRGRVEAARFVDGLAAEVTAPVLDMRGRPDLSAALSTQLLFGERVTVYDDDTKTGFAWVQADRDGYVGYVPRDGLGGPAEGRRLAVLSMGAQLYAEPALKSPPVATLPFMASVAVQSDGDWLKLADGRYISARHVGEVRDGDFVDWAERFIGAPYLWGGRSQAGLDCSALVQLSLMATGRDVVRDSDMQATLGTEVDGPLRRGDLLFWKGHVGIMRSETQLLHVNATHMQAVIEQVDPAVARIAQTDGPVIARRRLAAGTG